MLGRQGRRVAVCERWMTRYPLPRAVCIDHELYRALCANGLQNVLPRISHPGHRYQWFNAEWQKLLVIDWSADSMSGGTETNFVHQPTLGARNRSGNFGIMGRLLQGIGPSGAVFVLDGGRRG
jgi:2-polyprenyl-6-methoxyphenol hydroxylase-like FAD-dependent oxidoreductase